MPKYSQYQADKPKEDKKRIHPVWRGIGCLLMVLIPAFSYFSAIQLFKTPEKFTWVIIPEDIVISTFKDPLILVKLLYAGVIAFIFFAVIGLITFVIERIFGPSRYGPYDVRK